MFALTALASSRQQQHNLPRSFCSRRDRFSSLCSRSNWSSRCSYSKRFCCRSTCKVCPSYSLCLALERAMTAVTVLIVIGRRCLSMRLGRANSESNRGCAQTVSRLKKRPIIGLSPRRHGDPIFLRRHNSGQVITWETRRRAIICYHSIGIVDPGWRCSRRRVRTKPPRWRGFGTLCPSSRFPCGGRTPRPPSPVRLLRGPGSFIPPLGPYAFRRACSSDSHISCSVNQEAAGTTRWRHGDGHGRRHDYEAGRQPRDSAVCDSDAIAPE
jgi:hypothetical protein